MEKCPFCLAETRPGDNFCLNCGNRLTPASSSPVAQQAQSGIGDATLAAPDDWGAFAPAPAVGATAYNQGQSPQAPMNGWGDATSMPTQAATQADQMEKTVAGSIDTIDRPAQFVLRSENGEELETYALDKPEMTIGRAPTSDILLSKDKLTSRRHATVRHENGNYYLRDEGSANNTFLNGQQIETMTPRLLKDGDHVGIGEHELIFHGYGASTAVEDMPTVSVNYNPDDADKTLRMPQQEEKPAADDPFLTKPMEEPAVAKQTAPVEQPAMQHADATAMAPTPNTPAIVPGVPVPSVTSYPAPSLNGGASAPVETAPPAPEAAPLSTVAPIAVPAVPVATDHAKVTQEAMPDTGSSDRQGADSKVTFARLTNVQQPSLPDLTALMAAMSTLDGQVMSLQEQFSATQEAMRKHDAEIAQNANQLRTGVRRVSDRMDNTIADVARGRDQLGWSELLQLMEDVMNNPRDIEYVTKLARKARELNKIFQIQQNVLNTMAECNSLLRSMIGD